MSTFVAYIIFVLAFCLPAMAQRGSGSHPSGQPSAGSRGTGRNFSRGTQQSGATMRASAVPRATVNSSPSVTASRSTPAAAQRIPTYGWRSAATSGTTTSSSTSSSPAYQMHAITPSSTTGVATVNKVVNVTNVTNYNNGWHGGWWGAVSPIWWGFGYYSIGPGWYAPGYIYPNYWYWNGWAGYRVEHRPDSKHVSGLRIELVGVKDKKKREEAEKGIVQLSRDAGATWSVIGSVKRLMDHTYPLDPGNYAVKIVFAGKNRELDMTIEVEKGIPTYTPIVFDEPTSTTAQPAPQGPPTPPKS